MYSSLKNVQIIVAMLKQYNIDHIVISPGARHTPLVHSIEQDVFFKCYSVVDERTASFFAIGLIQELRTPVAICCTSGTASCNYVSAANEALFQQLPLLIITADRNPYYLFQQEEQMIPQINQFRDICKKVVTLPHVRDEKDFWYCARLANEAMLELQHRENGPVHINFVIENDYPIYQGIVKFKQEILPEIHKIDRLTLEDDTSRWEEKANVLATSKILIIYGQMSPLKLNEVEYINDFCKKYNCVISVDHLSNLYCENRIETFALMRFLNNEEIDRLCPDIIITMNANTVTEVKLKFSRLSDKFKHWHVSKEGRVSDPFKCLPDIIECSPIMFFKTFAAFKKDNISSHSYFDAWNNEYQKLTVNGGTLNCDVEYSSVYAIHQLIKDIPDNSLLHIGNSNSIRIANYFPINSSISVYCNRGTNGIDGSMSSFIGQAHVSGKLSFLIIGDLSFFYEMNALWNRYVGNNIRILVCNNYGGAIFHNYPNTTNVPTLDQHIAAEHTTSVKEWVKCRGFKYLTSSNKVEFDKCLPQLLVEDTDEPIVLDAYTDKDIDVCQIENLLKGFKPVTLKSTVASYMPDSMKNAIKKIIK